MSELLGASLLVHLCDESSCGKKEPLELSSEREAEVRALSN